MMRSWWLTFALLGVAFSAALAPRCPAQSAGKQTPTAPGERRFSIEVGIGPNGIMLKFGNEPAAPDPMPAIDAVGPSILPAYVQTLLDRMKTTVTPTAEGDRDKQAAQLFEIAEVYRRTGHFATAQFYYQRAHQAAPTSRLGRLAIDRLSEVEDRLRDAQDSSAIDPQSQFNQMRDRTIPLGLAQQATY